MIDENIEVMKVSGSTNPGALSVAIEGYLVDNKKVFISTIGMQSVYNAVKAMVFTNARLAVWGKKVAFVPVYSKGTNPDGDARTIIRWEVVSVAE